MIQTLPLIAYRRLLREFERQAQMRVWRRLRFKGWLRTRKLRCRDAGIMPGLHHGMQGDRR